MERHDEPGKLFAEDTLPYPNSVDGETPAENEAVNNANKSQGPGSGKNASAQRGPAVQYREDESQSADDPIEHTPSSEDVYAPVPPDLKPGADIADETPSGNQGGAQKR